MQRRSWISALALCCLTGVLTVASPLLHAQGVAADAFVKQVSGDVLDAVRDLNQVVTWRASAPWSTPR